MPIYLHTTLTAQSSMPKTIDEFRRIPTAKTVIERVRDFLGSDRNSAFTEEELFRGIGFLKEDNEVYVRVALMYLVESNEVEVRQDDGSIYFALRP